MLKLFRTTSWLEGLSLLTLVLIAMPAKYIFDFPELIPYVGMTHGVLWLLFFILSLMASHSLNWSVLKWVGSLISSLIPAGFIIFDTYITDDRASRATKTA